MGEAILNPIHKGLITDVIAPNVRFAGHSVATVVRSDVITPNIALGGCLIRGTGLGTDVIAPNVRFAGGSGVCH